MAGVAAIFISLKNNRKGHIIKNNRLENILLCIFSARMCDVSAAKVISLCTF